MARQALPAGQSEMSWQLIELVGQASVVHACTKFLVQQRSEGAQSSGPSHSTAKFVHATLRA